MIALGIIYAAYTIAQWSMGYIDFGDGNYMYIARRIAEGAVVYRDVLAPQPPCHLFLGALIIKLAALFRAEPLYFFRGLSVLLHLATYGLVIRLAMRAWGRPLTAVVAGLIYLWLPIGYWWALGYQSEPLEIFFLLLMMTFALRVTAWGDVLAGIFAALAALTNATAAPFLLVLIIYMLIRAPLRALRMLPSCLILAGGVVWGFQVWTGGAFWNVVFKDQAGTYLSNGFLEYALGKLLGQGSKVLELEGFFLFMGLIGFWRYLRRSPLEPVSRLGLGWFSLATLAAIGYVTKGGTVDYIFSLSEPAVAILAAGELVSWGKRWQAAEPDTETGWIPGTIPFLSAKIFATALLAIFALGFGLNFYHRLWNQAAYELPVDQVEVVTHLIKRFSAPNEKILAPPFYAFVANRPLWGDYSELFIWQMKFINDQQRRNPQGQGLRKVRKMAEALRARTLPIVILELDQTGKLPEIQEALRAAYVPLVSERIKVIRTLNTRLGLFVPAVGRTPEDKAEQGRKWQDFDKDLIGLYGNEGFKRQFGIWYHAFSENPPPAQGGATASPAAPAAGL